uniref:AlNc14C23G2374 protein n=1 Tax=Albugo laibachii Nc14 TaxID=890382 RepID=F0W675_9STRA|nr:AlNc14C23G2374 [Albugo laibachii Nc14]|eukprot:CCA16617.1 AlNc14C23G2374 [Albugo laibachii Nc14]
MTYRWRLEQQRSLLDPVENDYRGRDGSRCQSRRKDECFGKECHLIMSSRAYNGIQINPAILNYVYYHEDRISSVAIGNAGSLAVPRMVRSTTLRTD